MRPAPLLAIALVLSLGAHVARSMLGEPPARSAHAPAAPQESAARRDDASEGGPCSACEHALEVCSSSSRRVATDALRRKPRADAERARSAATGAPPGSQTEALCAKAKQSLAEGWARDRPAITAGLRKTLADPDERRRTADEKLEEMRGVLDLDGAAAARLDAAYHAVRSRHVAAAADAVAQDPPDFDAVLDEAKELFEAEDAMVREAGGDDALASWREDQLDGRTVILALIAALAEKPWDDRITW